MRGALTPLGQSWTTRSQICSNIRRMLFKMFCLDGAKVLVGKENLQRGEGLDEVVGTNGSARCAATEGCRGGEETTG